MVYNYENHDVISKSASILIPYYIPLFLNQKPNFVTIYESLIYDTPLYYFITGVCLLPSFAPKNACAG